jgi:hypothetical protein
MFLVGALGAAWGTVAAADWEGVLSVRLPLITLLLLLEVCFWFWRRGAGEIQF